MHARASAQYCVHIGDMEAIARILSARLCRAYITHAHCSSIAASIVLHSLASHTLQFDLADCGTFVVPTKVQAGFGTEAFKSVLSRQYRDGWTVCMRQCEPDIAIKIASHPIIVINCSRSRARSCRVRVQITRVRRWS